MAFKKTGNSKFDGRSPRRTSGHDDRHPRFEGKARAPARAKPYGRSEGGFQLHDAICAKCGQSCQVPFRPTAGGKPVLCRNCFNKDDNEAGPRNFYPPKGPMQANASAHELREINEKLDKIMRHLEIE